MDGYIWAAEQISLFCRLNMNARPALPIRSSEMGMLIYLCQTDGDKTPTGIARFFNVSKARATNMVTSMHQRGYVEKKACAADRRSSYIIPTKKAQSLVENAYEAYYQSLRALRERLGEADFAALLALLERANNVLLEEKEHGSR